MAEVSLGEIIDNRYRIDSVLGEGGFGIVYRATQISTGQPVAVKFLLRERLELAKDAMNEIARFQREMRLIAQLKHPNIVRLIDTGKTDDDELYIVLEYVDGDTLFDVVEREGALAVDDAARVMFQVLDALSAAHRQGVIHRDLKPQNIMLPTTGFSRNAMVLDFGVAGIAEQARDANYVSLTTSDEVRGTPAYMAPEQLRNEKPTEQIDIYAWGLVFIEVLTGEKAVEGANAFETALMQADATPVRIPKHIDDPELRRIIATAVAKPMAQRYATADAALQDLRAWQSGGKKPLGSGAYTPRTTPPADRERTVLTYLFAGLVGLLCLMGAGLAWWFLAPSSDPPKAAPPCTAHSACGEQELCGPAGACVAWASESCSILEGPLGNDHAVVVGAIGPIDQASYVPREQAMRLAVREFNEFGVLPAGRKIVMVSCNDSGQREQGLSAARHLVDNLGAVAIVGPGYSSIFMDVVGQVTQPASVFAISNSATSPAITDLDDDGLAWRTVPSDVHQSDALVQLVKDRGYKRVVVLAKGDTYGTGLLDRVSSGLVGVLGDGLVARTYPESSPDLESIIPETIKTQPEAVLVFGTTEVVDILAMAEGLVARQGLTSPTYLLSEAARRPEVLTLVKRLPALSGRIEVVGPSDSNGEVYEGLVIRFEAAFNAPADAAKLGNAYDATYVVAYGIGAVPAESAVSGLRIADAVRRLIEGEPVVVGPTNIAPTLAKLHRGESVDLVGASGALDFDLNSGDVEADTLLWVVVGDAPAFQPQATFRRDEGGKLALHALPGREEVRPTPAAPTDGGEAPLVTPDGAESADSASQTGSVGADPDATTKVVDGDANSP